MSYYLKYLIDKEDSSYLISINIESVIKESANDIIKPCKTLPNCDVIVQETSRLSLAEIVDPKFPSKSIESTSSTFTLRGQQNRGKAAGCIEAGLTGGNPV
jgi:hypothetical protein